MQTGMPPLSNTRAGEKSKKRRDARCSLSSSQLPLTNKRVQHVVSIFAASRHTPCSSALVRCFSLHAAPVVSVVHRLSTATRSPLASDLRFSGS